MVNLSIDSLQGAQTYRRSRTAIFFSFNVGPERFQNSSQLSIGSFFSVSRPIALRKSLGVLILAETGYVSVRSLHKQHSSYQSA